jgi:hypothetical protein
MSAVCSSLSSGCEGELFLCVFLQTAPLSSLPVFENLKREKRG